MASANGKVILCGEHSVVYGGDALALGLPCGVEAHATAASTASLTINGATVGASEVVVEALHRVLHRLSLPAAAVAIQLRMPVGVGLGASAAMAVAVARAVTQLYNRPCEQTALLEAAHVWESVFHGNPSGVDAACAALGGCISFNRNRGPTAVAVGATLYLAIAVASPASLTKEMVGRVAAVREADGNAFEQALRAIQDIVLQARKTVGVGDHAALGVLLDRNHALLCEWGLSTPGIETACHAARAAGAFGVKLTGAGGGGCVLAVCNASTQLAVVDAWKQLSLETLAVRIEPTGLTLPDTP